MNQRPEPMISRSVVVRPLAEDGYLSRQDFMAFEELFNTQLDVYFYVKDIDGRWISCNFASLKLINMRRAEQVIGQLEEAFFPKQIAEDIRKDDLKVLNEGKRVVNRVEVITNRHGEFIWVNTNKIPIYNEHNCVIGLMGITRPIMNQLNPSKKYELFSQTVDFIHDNLTETISIVELAKAANLSESHFRRKFRAELGLSPQEFIMRARLRFASKLLRNGSKNIAQIAFESGFSDQSYFSRQFKKFYGQTPKAYRDAKSVNIIA